MCAITDNSPKDEVLSSIPPPTVHPHVLLYESLSKSVDDQPLVSDVLARVTHAHRRALHIVYGIVGRLLQIKFVRVLLSSTQPAHIIALTSVLIVTSLFLPSAVPQSVTNPPPSAFIYFVYLASISIHVGAQVWMTFVSGLALYFSLPRHAFGEVQKVLFPKYFALNSILSGFTIVTFGRIHQTTTWEPRHWVQLFDMLLCFVIELVIRLYVAPTVVYLINEKTAIEKTVPGVGEEIGCHAPKQLARCPHYMGLHRTFRKYHLVVAMGNIIAMTCTALQIFYVQHEWASCSH